MANAAFCFLFLNEVPNRIDIKYLLWAHTKITTLVENPIASSVFSISTIGNLDEGILR